MPDDPRPPVPRPLTRRALLRGAVVLGAATATGTLAAPAPAHAAVPGFPTFRYLG